MFFAGASGAVRERLLPASVPFRFFAAAGVFHVIAWLALFAARDGIAAQGGGLGPGFAALHLFTLGVLATTAIGASLQLLPIATRQPVVSVRAAKALWWLLVPGIAVFSAGVAVGPLWLAAAGAAGVVGGLLVYAVLLWANLRRARGMKLVVAHAWAALAALVGLALSGATLLAHYQTGLLHDHRGAAIVHLALAAYGFMGLLSIGFSDLLVPMLAMSPAPGKKGGAWVLGVGAASLVLAVVLVLAGAPRGTLAIPALAGAAAAIAHGVRLALVLRRRHQRANVRWLWLLGASWVLLPASLVAAALLALDAPVPHLPALFALLLVPGWLLTLLLGILQRIAPFLASVHAAARVKPAPTPSSLTAERPLDAHAACHGLALVLLAVGISLGHAPLVAAGTLAGLAGAAAYAGFLGTLMLRLARLAPRAVA